MSEVHSKFLVPYCLSNLVSSKKPAFTLAEVLITLGIIGVVAAMTIPTLVSNYQKKQFEVKLKQTYSILSQALQMAQVEHGDPSTWMSKATSGIHTDDTSFNKEDFVNNVFDNYLAPNLKIQKDFGYTSYREVGITTSYPNGAVESRNLEGRIFLLSNNVIIRMLLDNSSCKEYNDDGSCKYFDYTNISFDVDLNGFSSPNCFGKDIFWMILSAKDGKFLFYNESATLNNNKSDCYNENNSNTTLYRGCGSVIKKSGWKIPDDYPWL